MKQSEKTLNADDGLILNSVLTVLLYIIRYYMALESRLGAILGKFLSQKMNFLR